MMIESFLRYLRYELNLSAHTVLSYKNDISQWQKYIEDTGNVFDITTIPIESTRMWIASLSLNGIGMRSIRRKVSALKALYRYLIRQGYVENSPLDDLELSKPKKRLPVFVRPAAMDTLLDEDYNIMGFEDLRDYLIISILYNTGIREAELIGINDEDVDLKKCQIRVIGKRNKERIVPFGNELADVIQRYIYVRNENCGTKEGSLVVRKNGETMYPQLVYKVVHQKLSEVATATKLSPHVLRHTFASAMLNNGAEINSVKELLGHESLAATQVYTHITFSELKHSYEHAHPRAIKKGGDYGH